MDKIFFNSSMPYSGSTLLQNIMGQDDRFHVTPTNGLLDLLLSARKYFTEGHEFKAQDEEEMLKSFCGFCKGGISGFYSHINKPFVIDKCRAWAWHYDFIKDITGENPKIIVMVRDLKQIIASAERKFRRGQLKQSWFIDHEKLQGTNLVKRFEIYLNSNPVNISLDWFLDVIQRGLDKHILFVDYNKLCKNPAQEVKGIYDYLEIKPKKINFGDIKQVTLENDNYHGIFGDHKIKKAVKPQKDYSSEILGDVICKNIDEKYKWYNDIIKNLT